MQKKQETIAKINKAKSWFLKKINKIDNPLNTLIKKQREKNHINKIRNENGEITADNTEIQRIMREYYQQLYDIKMDNLEEMDKLLEKYKFPKLNQEETENVNTPITRMEIKTNQKYSSKQKPRTSRLHSWILPKFRDELTPILLKLFQKSAEEGILPKSFYEATITLIQKPDKDATKKKKKKTTGQYHWWT